MNLEPLRYNNIGENKDNSSELPHNFHNGAISIDSCNNNLSLMDMMDNSGELSHISTMQQHLFYFFDLDLRFQELKTTQILRAKKTR